MTPSPGIEPGPHWWEACVGDDWIIETRVGQGAFVALVVQRVEEMREEPLTQFRQAEGGGKGGERKRQEAERVLEGEAIGGEGQDLGAHGDLTRDLPMQKQTNKQTKNSFKF